MTLPLHYSDFMRQPCTRGKENRGDPPRDVSDATEVQQSPGMEGSRTSRPPLHKGFDRDDTTAIHRYPHVSRRRRIHGGIPRSTRALEEEGALM